MRTTAKITTWLAGILLVISTAFQLLAMLGGVLLNNSSVLDDKPWLLTGWIAALALLLVGFILNSVLKEKGHWPLLPLILSAVGAFLALLVALTLKNTFPSQISSTGAIQGLTTWRLCYRHLSSVAVGVLVAFAALLHIFENRAQRIKKENDEYKSIYDLSGAPLFKDNSTIGLEYYAGEDGSGPKPKRKRSLRQAEKKAAEAARKEAAAAAQAEKTETAED